MMTCRKSLNHKSHWGWEIFGRSSSACLAFLMSASDRGRIRVKQAIDFTLDNSSEPTLNCLLFAFLLDAIGWSRVAAVLVSWVNATPRLSAGHLQTGQIFGKHARQPEGQPTGLSRWTLLGFLLLFPQGGTKCTDCLWTTVVWAKNSWKE